MTTTHIAIAFIGVGSAYGQAASEGEAIKQLAIQLKGWGDRLGKPEKGTRIPAHIFDYVPYSHIRWEDSRVYGTVENSEPPVEKALTPIKTVWLDHKLKVVEETRPVVMLEPGETVPDSTPTAPASPPDSTSTKGAT